MCHALEYYFQPDNISIVGIITRSISVASDAAVLFYTISVTWGIVRIGSNAGTSTTLASALLRNGECI